MLISLFHQQCARPSKGCDTSIPIICIPSSRTHQIVTCGKRPSRRNLRKRQEIRKEGLGSIAWPLSGMGNCLQRISFGWLLLQAVCDLPTAAFIPELFEAYPDSKAIIVQRPVDKWYDACKKTVQTVKTSSVPFVLLYLDPYFLGRFIPSSRQWTCWSQAYLVRWASLQSKSRNPGPMPTSISTRKLAKLSQRTVYSNSSSDRGGSRCVSSYEMRSQPRPSLISTRPRVFKQKCLL